MKLAAIFQDGMVLQREKPIRIWGESEQAQTITVWVDNKLVLETDISSGDFSITLPPQPTAWDSRLCLKAKGKILVELKDVKFGEVWLAGGQSNMEFFMKQDSEYKKERKICANSHLFCYTVPKIYAEEQIIGKDIQQQGKWYPCTKDGLAQWTAVGYYFAKKLAESLPDIPVGIVSCNYGGSYMVSWLPGAIMEEDPLLAPFWKNYQEHCASLDMVQYRETFNKEQQLGQNPIYKLIVDKLYMKGRISESFVEKLWTQRDGKPVENSVFGPWDKWRPAGLYEWMLKKVAGFAIRGVIWYQGEAEAETARVELYTRTMEVLMKQWQTEWNDTFPFLMVELAPFRRDIFQDGSRYPEIRAMQRALSQKHKDVYTVSIMDAGSDNNIHPPYKRPVGERLAQTAAANVYGKPVAWQAPEGIQAEWNGKEVIVSFANAEGLHTPGNETVNCFDCVTDGLTTTATEAVIRDNTIYLAAEKCPDSIAFAWTDYCKVNLYNQDGLATRPFRLVVKK